MPFLHLPWTFRFLKKIFDFGLLTKNDKMEETTESLKIMEFIMAGASNRFPPLYIAACIIFCVGLVGLGCIFVLQLPSYIFKGLLYIFIGFISFGIGENLNHSKIPSPAESPDIQQFYRKRNVCSLGNLLDIGALLLFFVGLSDLLFPL